MTTPVQGQPYSNPGVADDASAGVNARNIAEEAAATSGGGGGGGVTDADLIAIGNLDSANDTLIQRKASTWVARTPAQVRADMGLSADYDTLITQLVADTGTALATKLGRLTRTAVKTTSTFSVAAGDLNPIDTTSNNVAGTLPTTPADGTIVALKHVTQGGTNTVTITCGGSAVFNKSGGATSLTLPYLNQAVVLEYTATGDIWTVLADDIPLSALDLRYVKLSETVSTDAAVTGTKTIPDVTTATQFNYSLTASTTFTMPTAAAGKSFTVLLTYGGTYTPTFTGVKWSGGTAPAFSSANTKKDLVSFTCIDGTNWIGLPPVLDIR